jgi:glucuronosyltransferase
MILFFRNALCKNILGVFPIEAQSHQIVFDSYMSELHRRGHNVTVYSHFPEIASEPYKIIKISNTTTSVLNPNYITMDNMNSPSIFNSYKHMFCLVSNGQAYAQSDSLRELYAQPEDTYDLIVTETCNTDLYLALVGRFKAPFVAWTTSPLFVWSADRMGTSSNPAYIPVLMTQHGTDMSFLERWENTLLRSVAFYKYFIDSTIPSQEIATKHYKSLMPLHQLVFKTSFLFVHTHYSLWGSRPLPHNVVEVGGLHVRPSKLQDAVTPYL